MTLSRIDDTRDKMIKDNLDLVIDKLTDIEATPWERIIANCVQMRINELVYENTLLRCALNKERNDTEALKKENNELKEDNRNLKCIKTQLLETNNHINNNSAKLLEENKKLKNENKAQKEIINDYRKDYYEYSDKLVEEHAGEE